MKKLMFLSLLLAASLPVSGQTLLNTFTAADSGVYDVTPVPNGATSMSISVTGIGTTSNWSAWLETSLDANIWVLCGSPVTVTPGGNAIPVCPSVGSSIWIRAHFRKNGVGVATGALYNGTYTGGSGSYTLPPASTTVLGGIKPDGTSCTTNTSGVLSCSGGGGSLPSGANGNPQVKNGTSFGAESPIFVFEAGVNGAVCDDTTDDTTAFNTLLSTVYTAGGGTIKIYGTCLISGQVSIPNSGASTNPLQPTIRITGAGSGANGAWLSTFTTASALDMRFATTYGKILTLGQGRLEIDHLTLKDGGSDCTPFVYTTNTTLLIHDDLFSGTASGTSACNDAVILGGTTATDYTLDPTDTFQGYGTVIRGNFFDKIRRGVYLRSDANAIVVQNNTWSHTCGGTTSSAAVEIGGSSGVWLWGNGNIFSGNLYESANYPYVIWVHTSGNMFNGESIWDASGTTLYAFHFTDKALLAGADNIANVFTDASFTLSNLSDNNQPTGTNAVMDQTWQAAVGFGASMFLNGYFSIGPNGSATISNVATASHVPIVSFLAPNAIQGPGCLAYIRGPGIDVTTSGDQMFTVFGCVGVGSPSNWFGWEFSGATNYNAQMFQNFSTEFGETTPVAGPANGIAVGTTGQFQVSGAGAVTAPSLNGLATPTPAGNANFTQTINANTAAMEGGTAIAAGACATTVTVASASVATTDVIAVGFNSDPTGVTGYVPGISLTIVPFPTAGNVNFKLCNYTASSITPTAITINWRVQR